MEASGVVNIIKRWQPTVTFIKQTGYGMMHNSYIYQRNLVHIDSVLSCLK